MNPYRILSSCTIEFQGQSPVIKLIESADFTIDVKRPQPGWLDAETREKIVGYHALLAGGENLNATTMDRADDILIIARNGVGYDKVDLDYCTECGIIVTNTPGAMADAVADIKLGEVEAAATSSRLIANILADKKLRDTKG